MKRAALLAAFFSLIFLAAPPLATDAAATYQVVHGWPQLPDGYALGQVTGVDVDSHNCVWVFHRGARTVLRLNADSGEILSSFGDGMITQAHGLSVDAGDNVWLTDSNDHVVHQFNHDGKHLRTLGKKGEPAEDETHFNKPTDVEVAPDGSIYVSDGYGNSRVVRLSSKGKFLTAWGRKGQGDGDFDTPHGVAIDKQGQIYIADRGNSRIQVFDGDGKFLKAWKSDGIGRPWGLDIGPDGSLFVADGGDLTGKAYDRNRALRMNLDGRILDKWGSYGSQDGQFYWAHDIAAGPDGAVYVTDVNVGMRVQKFVKK